MRIIAYQLDYGSVQGGYLGGLDIILALAVAVVVAVAAVHGIFVVGDKKKRVAREGKQTLV